MTLNFLLRFFFFIKSNVFYLSRYAKYHFHLELYTCPGEKLHGERCEAIYVGFSGERRKKMFSDAITSASIGNMYIFYNLDTVIWAIKSHERVFEQKERKTHHFSSHNRDESLASQNP